MKFKSLFLNLVLLAVGLLLYPVASKAQLNATYSTSIIGLVPGAAATDLFTVTGSSSKLIYITKVIVTCTQTTAGSIDVALLTRSTADSSGTSTNPTRVAHDPGNQGNATATINAYTANPTPGTLVGNLGTYKLNCPTASAGAAQDLVLETFGITADQVVLRNTSQVFAVNLNAQTVTGGSFDIRVEWREN